jgi:hypothetical protein
MLRILHFILHPAAFFSILALTACGSSDTSSDTPSPTDGGSGAPEGNGGTSGGGSSAPSPGDPNTVVGTFTASLIAPSETEPSGHTSFVGKVYDRATPAQIVWEEAKTSGSCRLSTPRVPFCNTPCGGSAVCVDDDKCQDYPTAQTVGTVTVTGIKTSRGGTEFSMDPVAKTYQPPASVQLPFPAFDEGTALDLQAAGGDLKAFTISAKGVAALALDSAELKLSRADALPLRWTAAKSASASSVHVKLDISHHGGSKAMIECDSNDSGSLDIAAELIAALLDKGYAGFPTIIVTRHNDGSAQLDHGKVQLVASSQVERAVVVPGLASCSEDDQCPSGQKCQSDLTCK